MATQRQDKYLFKITLVGDAKVGKTGLFNRYTERKFPEESKQTISADFTTKEVQVGDQPYTLQVWDTPGEPRFVSLGTGFLRSSNAVAIVLDGTKTVVEQKWVIARDLARIQENCRRMGDVYPEAEIYFWVNKIDATDDQPFKGEAEFQNGLASYAQLNGNDKIKISFCSAKTGEGVDQAFEAIAKDWVQKTQEESTKTERPSYVIPAAVLSPPDKDAAQRFLKLLKVWGGVDILLILGWIVLFGIAASPVGAVFALGALSALATVAIIGGASLLVWNVACGIAWGVLSKNQRPSSEVDNPLSTSTNFGSTPSATSASTSLPVQGKSPIAPPPGSQGQPASQGNAPSVETPEQRH